MRISDWSSDVCSSDLSGSGKSVTALSILQLLPYPTASHAKGSSIAFRGRELVGASQQELQQVRGNRISMVFQEPMSSLNPLHTAERTIKAVLFLHKRQDKPGGGAGKGGGDGKEEE